MIQPNYDKAMHFLRVERMTNLYLYYYTNPDTFFKIMKNMCIRSSNYDKVNDLDEANLDCLNGNWKRFEVEAFIRDKCHFISFVQDYKKSGVPIEGTQHPRMWAQYAQNSEGVCFILNKKEFLRKCRKERGRNAVMMGKISYKWSKYSQEERETIDKFCINSSPEEIARKYRKYIFLTKHIDWEQEHETRLFIMEKEIIDRENDETKIMLSIDGCIEGICLGYKFLDDSKRVIKLATLLTDSHYKFSDQINLNAFGLIASTDGGYDSCSIKDTFHLPNKILPLLNAFTKLLKENYPL